MKSFKWGNPLQKIKCELRYANPKPILICAALFLLFGMLTGIFGGGALRYRDLLLPRLALSAAGFILIWSIFYLILGGCAGFLIGCEPFFGSKCTRSGLFTFLLLILSNLLWYPIFFGIGSFLIAFLFLILHLLITLFALCRFCRVSVILTVCLSCYTIWLIYCLFINFCVILLNA